MNVISNLMCLSIEFIVIDVFPNRKSIYSNCKSALNEKIDFNNTVRHYINTHTCIDHIDCMLTILVPNKFTAAPMHTNSKNSMVHNHTRTHTHKCTKTPQAVPRSKKITERWRQLPMCGASYATHRTEATYNTTHARNASPYSSPALRPDARYPTILLVKRDDHHQQRAQQQQQQQQPHQRSAFDRKERETCSDGTTVCENRPRIKHFATFSTLAGQQQQKQRCAKSSACEFHKRATDKQTDTRTLLLSMCTRAKN